jgi:thioredoxin reductase
MTSVDLQYDVVIIGGGAAGLSGAVALARSRRSVLVVDAGQPRNAPADGVHNYLGREGTSPGELLAIGRAELAGYGGEVVSGVVTAARRVDDGDFRVTLDDGREVSARRLLVATGLVDELPDLPGVAERWGRDVLHCPYCHGWEVRDQPIGILATGPNAVHQALLFRQLSDDVTFFRHTGPELPEEEAAQLAALGVRMVDGEVVSLEVTGDRLTGVRLASGEVVPRSVVVVAPRFTANDQVLASLGLAATEQEMRGHVVGSAVAADPTGATAVPGVWVAGNVADMSAQVVVSAAAGLRAGAMINADLVMEDARLAVAAPHELAGAR